MTPRLAIATLTLTLASGICAAQETAGGLLDNLSERIEARAQRIEARVDAAAKRADARAKLIEARLANVERGPFQKLVDRISMLAWLVFWLFVIACVTAMVVCVTFGAGQISAVVKPWLEWFGAWRVKA